MLIKFFNHGTKASGNTSSKSVKNYLLNDERVKKGTAKIIRGDEPLTSETIDKSEHSSTYTAGCLSFDKKEHLTDEQKQAIMQSFEEALLPNFDPTRFTCYWVEHTDKERLELNFVFAKTDLATGKHLDVYYHRRDKKRLDNWKEIQIQKYNLEDPNDPIHEQELKPFYSKRDNGSIIGDSLKEIKENLHLSIASNVNAGKIRNRQDIIDYITSIKDENQNQIYELTRQPTKKGISIRHKDKDKNIRLEGSLYREDFDINPTQAIEEAKSLIQADRQKRHEAYTANKDNRLTNAVEWFNKLCDSRSEQLTEKYKLPTPQKPSQSLDKSMLVEISAPTTQELSNEPTTRPIQLFEDFRSHIATAFTEYADFAEQRQQRMAIVNTILEDYSKANDEYKNELAERQAEESDRQADIARTREQITITEQRVIATKCRIDGTKQVFRDGIESINQQSKQLKRPMQSSETAIRTSNETMLKSQRAIQRRQFGLGRLGRRVQAILEDIGRRINKAIKNDSRAEKDNTGLDTVQRLFDDTHYTANKMMEEKIKKSPNADLQNSIQNKGLQVFEDNSYYLQIQRIESKVSKALHEKQQEAKRQQELKRQQQQEAERELERQRQAERTAQPKPQPKPQPQTPQQQPKPQPQQQPKPKAQEPSKPLNAQQIEAVEWLKGNYEQLQLGIVKLQDGNAGGLRDIETVYSTLQKAQSDKTSRGKERYFAMQRPTDELQANIETTTKLMNELANSNTYHALSPKDQITLRQVALYAKLEQATLHPKNNKEAPKLPQPQQEEQKPKNAPPPPSSPSPF